MMLNLDETPAITETTLGLCFPTLRQTDIPHARSRFDPCQGFWAASLHSGRTHRTHCRDDITISQILDSEVSGNAQGYEDIATCIRDLAMWGTLLLAHCQNKLCHPGPNTYERLCRECGDGRSMLCQTLRSGLILPQVI